LCFPTVAQCLSDFYKALLETVRPYCSPNVEITLEANPGTIDFTTACANQSKFHAYRQLGINRLSLGIQSFSPEKLKHIGRMHSDRESIQAIDLAKQAGFTNWNGDLMFGLPQQTLQEALYDLQTLIDLNPPHISWYQLTIEPNTHFYRRPPTLPQDDILFEIYESGQALLASAGYQQYEVSAYAQNQQYCRHNLNYWQFGDYIGIGAGAHGKITLKSPFKIIRTETPKHPRLYLGADQKHQTTLVLPEQYLFEAMLNLLRLQQPVAFKLIEQRTQLEIEWIQQQLQPFDQQGLLQFTQTHFQLTKKGQLFANDILAALLPTTEV
jgi:putative oxygen-independent coproporphyrinogen III oxidase